MYELPKSDAGRNRWIAAIPRANLVVTKYTAAYRKHWPENCNLKIVYGKFRPIDPPSIFPDVPKSNFATTSLQERTTKRACISAGITVSNELEKIEEQLIAKCSEIAENIRLDDMISYEHYHEVVMRSKRFVVGNLHDQNGEDQDIQRMKHFVIGLFARQIHCRITGYLYH